MIKDEDIFDIIKDDKKLLNIISSVIGDDVENGFVGSYQVFCNENGISEISFYYTNKYGDGCSLIKFRGDICYSTVPLSYKNSNSKIRSDVKSIIINYLRREKIKKLKTIIKL